MFLSRRLHHSLLKNRMLIFLIALIVILVLYPFLHRNFYNSLMVIELFFILLLIAVIFLVSNNEKTLMITPLLALLTCVVIWFNIFLHSPALLLTGLFLEICFFILTTIVLITHVLEYKHVTADKIYGAVSAYLVLAVIWAMIYTAIEIAFPNSFIFDHGLQNSQYALTDHRFYFSEFLYFSFVTLSTLGYGDITPISNEARTVTSLEAICGQLYVAVLIARLVGLHITHTHWERMQKEKKK